MGTEIFVVCSQLGTWSRKPDLDKARTFQSDKGPRVNWYHQA